ncbi:MAG: polysaccharide biosynthesis protein [Chloroflexi bacterium]|nr:polysaccharide biosynthesis protein [Chloroflexota bacterium]
MDIRGKNVLVLGAYGQVGEAVCKLLLNEAPARIVVASLRENEAHEIQSVLEDLRHDKSIEIIPVWGNLFVRSALKDVHPRELYSDPAMRNQLLADIYDNLDEEMLKSSFLYEVITGTAESLNGHMADIVIDSVNTATGLAYQNIFAKSHDVWSITRSDALPERDELNRRLEELMIAQYTPQLVRHVQILYQAFREARTQVFIKVGTSGTGGMGLNIPFTHGEEKPSRVLLSKAAMAGAHSLLIFLLARTPDGPTVVKEVKPTAAIAWKRIAYGPVAVGGNAVELWDNTEPVPVEDALDNNRHFGTSLGRPLESVFIDTGENGVFSLDEFKAITTLGQMMFITPQEIAQTVIEEILGGSTGKDIVSALDASVMGPTYRAGFLRESVLHRMKQLEHKHEVRSVAFEFLGPPRLSKLLFEAHLLELMFPLMDDVLEPRAGDISDMCLQEVKSNQELRSSILSIGIPILLPDGKTMLRGPVIKSQNAHDGWVDLTPENMARWKERIAAIIAQIDMHATMNITSSELDRAFPADREWTVNHGWDIGEIAGWIFIHEEGGLREKM